MSLGLRFKEKTRSAIAWKTFDTVIAQFVNFAISILLARLLSPSDYGLIGMITVFIIFSNLLVDSGFTSALIQNQERNDTDIATVFYFNFITSLFVYFILFFFASSISTFYNEPRLTLIIKILSFNIVLGALTLTQFAILTINLDFLSQAKVNVVSIVLSGIVGLLVALYGGGVWALVTQSLVNSSLNILLLNLLGVKIPEFRFSFHSISRLSKYSRNLLFAGFISLLTTNLYTLVIGKYFSSADLGFFTRAKQYSEIVANMASKVLLGVSFPVLSSLQSDVKLMTKAYDQLMGITIYIVIPIMTLMAHFSESFVRVMLTEKWLPAVPILQILCFSRIVTPISSLNLSMLKAVGRTDLFLKVNIIKIPITIILVYLSLPLGLYYLVITDLLLTVINYFINSYYPGKMFNYGVRIQMRRIWKILLAVSIAHLALYFTNQLLNADILFLFFGVPIGLGIYYLVTRFLKIPEVYEVDRLIRKLPIGIRY